MADIPPSIPGAPSGAVPPKKETGKVQPKKETVRINLPPKPSAAPTIKLPTLPPGGPTGAPSPVAPAIAKAPAPAAPAPAPAAAPVAKGAAPAAPAGAPRTAPQRAAAPIVPALKTMDKVLIYSACFMSLVAVGALGWVYYTLDTTVKTFNS